MVSHVDNEVRAISAQHPFDVPPVRFGADHVVRNEGSPLSYEAQAALEAAEVAETALLAQLAQERRAQIAVADTVAIRLEAFAAS